MLAETRLNRAQICIDGGQRRRLSRILHSQVRRELK